jgi:hypothetical protein
MNDVLSIKDHITASVDYIAFARNELQATLKTCSTVESIVILDLLNQLTHTHHELRHLADAVKS